MNFLLAIGILLIVAKLFGEIFDRISLPPLLGELAAGIILGPAIFGYIAPEPLQDIAILGIILLLFLVGFSFNVEKLKERGRRGGLISIFGFIFVLIPTYLIFQNIGLDFVHAVFFSLIMGGESTPNTIKTLVDLKKIKSEVAGTIISATIVEDIIFYTILALAAGLIGTTTIGEYGIAVGKVVLFFLLFLIMERLSPIVIKYSERMRTEEAQFAMGFILIVLAAYMADRLGFASVTGAFFAGIALSYSPYLKTGSFSPKLSAITLGVFAPLFFAWMGLQISPANFSVGFIVFELLVLSFIMKFLGNVFGSMLGRLDFKRSVGVAVGLSSRGGEQLLILVIAAQLGLFTTTIDTILIPTTIIMMLVTIFLSPVLLKLFFRLGGEPGS